MSDLYDVIIVGAGTAGSYFAYLLSKEGFKVCVIEKELEENVRKDVEVVHFPADGFKEFGLDEPKEGDPDFVEIFTDMYGRSALNDHETLNRFPVTVIYLHEFIERVKNLAINEGAEFIYGALVHSFLRDEFNNIIGVQFNKDGFSESVKGRLIVDASGIRSVLRRQSESEYIETKEIGKNDRFFVLLYYVKFDKGLTDRVATSWTYYKAWIDDYRKERTGAVIGCGASHSPEYVRKRMKVFLDSIPHDSFKIVKEELGSTPYNRTPYSFVGDNFLIIGDTALLTNPMNGEGITWNFRFLSKIKDVVFEALRKNNLSITSLWDVNTIYQKSIGASSSYTRAAMKGVMDSSPKDNDFLYRNHIIFKSDTDEEPKNMISVLFNGVRNKEYSSKAFKSLIKQSLIASKIKKHYEKYPNSPKGYKRWAKKADKLWMKAGHISDIDKDVI